MDKLQFFSALCSYAETANLTADVVMGAKTAALITLRKR